MSSILKTITDSRLLKLSLSSSRAYSRQQKVLKKLLLRAGNTEFGKEYHYADILFSDNVIHDFQKQVPFHTYKEMNAWWSRAYKGEKDVCWPGKVKYFALSSGTSEGASKYIPVTKQMIRSITRASMRQYVSIGRNKDVPSEFLTKHMLLIGGSTDLFFNGTNYSGDLSGITTSNVPMLFQSLTKPEMHIRALKNWEDKISHIVAEAKNWDVSFVAGVPAWVQIIFEKIIEHYQVKTIHDIWPNLKVYTWGGVSIEPYRKSIDKLCAKPLQYWETYLASEGFFSYQSKLESKGMKLLLNNGVFFEFIPFDEKNFDADGNVLETAQAVTIKDVKKGVSYALVISTCSGAWRYLIGDTVEFVNINNNEIKITGRTKHYLSMCGEHLSVENMTQAVQETAEAFGVLSNEFTVAGIAHEGRHAHDWYIGTDKSVDIPKFKEMLDKKLCELNDDYCVERKHALKDIFITCIPNEKFNAFLNTKGKQGSQTKFPRVLKGNIYEEWKSFLKQ